MRAGRKLHKLAAAEPVGAPRRIWHDPANEAQNVEPG